MLDKQEDNEVQMDSAPKLQAGIGVAEQKQTNKQTNKDVSV